MIGRPEHIDSISHDGTWHYQLSGIKTWYIRPTDTLLQQMQMQMQMQMQINKSQSQSQSSNVSDAHEKEECDNVSNQSKSIRIDCKKGDFLLLNTRLWWHRTELPVQVQPLTSTSTSTFTILPRNDNDNDDDNDEKRQNQEKDKTHQASVIVPSVSYARDIYLPSNFWYKKSSDKENNPNHDHDNDGDDNDEWEEVENEGCKQEQQVEKDGDGDDDNDDEKEEDTMTNVDGLYAANDIEPQTVIFTEKNMPNCELHRSRTDPNCEVVELEDGTGALVSLRAIPCGEFFCVRESSDEESGSDEEDGEDDWDEEDENENENENENE